MRDLIYNLAPGSHIRTAEGLEGVVLGTDGMYAKVQWDGREYSERNPWDFYIAVAEVEVIDK